MNLKNTILLAAFTLLLVGCERKFTRDRFDMIKVGVDERYDVAKILGDPTTTFSDSDQWFYEDEDDHYQALIHFSDDGKVAGKQWMDGNSGEFSGDNPHADRPPQGQTRSRSSNTRRIDP